MGTTVNKQRSPKHSKLIQESVLVRKWDPERVQKQIMSHMLDITTEKAKSFSHIISPLLQTRTYKSREQQQRGKYMRRLVEQKLEAFLQDRPSLYQFLFALNKHNVIDLSNSYFYYEIEEERKQYQQSKSNFKYDPEIYVALKIQEFLRSSHCIKRARRLLFINGQLELAIYTIIQDIFLCPSEVQRQIIVFLSFLRNRRSFVDSKLARMLYNVHRQTGISNPFEMMNRLESKEVDMAGQPYLQTFETCQNFEVIEKQEKEVDNFQLFVPLAYTYIWREFEIAHFYWKRISSSKVSSGKNNIVPMRKNFILMMTLFHLKHHEKYKEQLDMLLKRVNKHNKSLSFVQEALLAKVSGNTEKALEILRQTGPYSRWSSFALIDSAECHQDMGHFKEAESIFKKVSVNRPRFNCQLPMFYERQGKLAEAELCYRLIASTGNDNQSFAHYKLAQLYQKQGRLQAALAVLKKGLRQNESFPLLNEAMAEVLGLTGSNREKQMECYGRLAREWPRIRQIKPHLYNRGTGP